MLIFDQVNMFPLALVIIGVLSFRNPVENVELFVPGTGLEPAHLSAYASETYVSANSTTRAIHC